MLQTLLIMITSASHWCNRWPWALPHLTLSKQSPGRIHLKASLVDAETLTNVIWSLPSKQQQRCRKRLNRGFKYTFIPLYLTVFLVVTACFITPTYLTKCLATPCLLGPSQRKRTSVAKSLPPILVGLMLILSDKEVKCMKHFCLRLSVMAFHLRWSSMAWRNRSKGTANFCICL